MDREQEINEMAEAMVAVCDDCENCKWHKYGNYCTEAQQAEGLLDLGYRRMNEIAQEIKEDLKEIYRFVLRNKGNTSIPYFNAEEIVFDKMDREVDRLFLEKYKVKVTK